MNRIESSAIAAVIDSLFISVASLAFVTGLGEFVASIVLYTHSTRPISIEILSQLRDFDLGAAAAYGVLLMVIVAGAFGLAQRWIQGEPA